MPYTTKEEILQLGVIDPEFEEALRALDLPPVDYGDIHGFIEGANQRAEEMNTLLGDPPAGVHKSEIEYPTADGTKLRAVLSQPATPPAEGESRPLIVLFYGGGFCVGSPEGEEQTARNLVQAFGAVCFCPVYRLAPKYPFPYAIKDAWDALRFAAANAKAFGADPVKAGFVIGGTSAGGQISAALSHVARDEGLSPPLTGQYLAIPAVCSPNAMPEKYKDRALSYEQNVNAPVLPVEAIDMFMGAYRPDTNDGVWYNSMNHPKGHANLPPAFFQIDGMDPLRDEALIYESILREDFKIKTKLEVYPGVPHGHWGFFPQLKSSQRFRKEQVEGIGWLLGKTPAMEKTETKVAPAVV